MEIGVFYQFVPSSGDLFVPDVGAFQGSDLALHGGDVLSHVSTALAGRLEGHAPGRASRVVPGIDKPIPMHEHEQGSADMQHVCGAKEFPAADISTCPQVLGEHHQGVHLGGRPAHLHPDPGDLVVYRYPADKA